jgi:hypothetical protein
MMPIQTIVSKKLYEFKNPINPAVRKKAGDTFKGIFLILTLPA